MASLRPGSKEREAMTMRIGIDVGATKTKIIMITKQGEIVARSKIMTDSDKVPGPIVERAAAAVEDLMRERRVKADQVEAVAVGICGFLNPRTGIIQNSPNLHWKNVPFKKLMEKRLGRTVYVANDVNAAAWGEFEYGAGRGAQDIIAIFAGSGIGGGIVCNGRLVEGGTGTAGEVGHLIFRENGLKCDCGQRGCFEAYGGGMPMERRMRNAAKQGKSPLTLKLAKGELSAINTRVIRLAAAAGDPVAKKIWEDAEASLGILCANLVSLLNPDRLVIGGGVVEGNPGLMKTIRETIKAQAVGLAADHNRVVKSECGDDAVAIGAAALVDLYKESPGGERRVEVPEHRFRVTARRIALLSDRRNDVADRRTGPAEQRSVIVDHRARVKPLEQGLEERRQAGDRRSGPANRRAGRVDRRSKAAERQSGATDRRSWIRDRRSRGRT